MNEEHPFRNIITLTKGEGEVCLSDVARVPTVQVIIAPMIEIQVIAH